MIEIASGIKHFLDRQHFVVVSSLDKNGGVHTSLKGIIKIDPKGKIFLLDLYKARTYRNIKENPHVTLTVVDDHKFKGYSIRGKAKIVKEDSLSKTTLDIWHERLSKRIARRVIRHVKEEKSDEKHIPEARFPLPKYVIEVDVDRIVDLAPHKLKNL